ncbi:MAG: L,D-transpeptidase family protein [Candidatus Binatia bacterium]
MLRTSLLIILLSLSWTSTTLANEWRSNTAIYSYSLESNGGKARRQQMKTVIGRFQEHKVRGGETLLDIARHYQLGYRELVQANPGVDPWVPPVGVKIRIPSVWIIPDGSRQGLVLNIPERRVYYYLSGSEVMTFALGIGREGRDTPPGKYWIGEKRVNPMWHVPVEIQREMEVPRKVVPPGPDNPLGRYWMRLSATEYGIHGTNNPWAVGRDVTRGCIRLYPEDIAFLFPRVPPRTPVEVIYQYAKVGMRDGKAYFQVYRMNGEDDQALLNTLIREMRSLRLAVDLRLVRRLLRNAADGELIPLRR